MQTAHYIGPWANFYVMTGTSAAALIGLMFVVITLVTSNVRSRRSVEGTAVFNTPTVVHFCAALLFSALLASPWRSLMPLVVLLAVAALCGIAYVARNAYRMRHFDMYTPDAEDWIWHTVLTTLAYCCVLAGAIGLTRVPAQALFVIAGAVIVLLFVGIHNAWDVVTYLTIEQPDEPHDSGEI